MSGQKIKIEFDRFGNTRVDAVGFAGKGCVEATAYVEQALAGVKTKDDPNSDMYAPAGSSSTEASLRF